VTAIRTAGLRKTYKSSPPARPALPARGFRGGRKSWYAWYLTGSAPCVPDVQAEGHLPPGWP
jgi:hypothetical protein